MGLLDQAKQWMTPERALAMQGIGLGMSQLGAGQPVNLTPVYDALQTRRDAAQMRKVMEVPGIMDQFTPQQQAVLASMPEELATKIIMESAFQTPEPMKGIEVDGRLLNPVTGEVMWGGVPETEELPSAVREIQWAAEQLGYKPGTPEYAEYVRSRTENPQSASDPVTRTIKTQDGAEVLVQWNADTEQWDPAPIPEGGTSGQPRSKLTESQARTTLFQSVQTETAPILSSIEEAWDPANLSDAAARSVPIAGNFFQSGQGQMYSSAAKAWADGALRLSTGSAATEPEIERVVATYFAVPGDTPATIEFKRSMRAMYERAIKRSLGENSVPGQLMLPADFAGIVAPQEPEMTREDALKILGGK